MIRFAIGARRIGEGRPYVIAEAGVNHDGDPDRALALVDAAAEVGADAVKFQTFRASALALADAPQAAYQRERAAASSQQAMLAALELPREALAAARRRATDRGIDFLSTPFDEDSLRLLVGLGVPALKIGSGDLTNLPLVRAAAATGLPLILSTGMATIAEIERVLRHLGDASFALLHCTSAYPSPAADANLRAMDTLRRRFDVVVGYSDHTQGTAVAIAAAALGAAIIEKHLTLDRSLPGPDHAASLEPTEFAAMLAGIREAHDALGDGVKAPRAVEADAISVARRSIVTARPMPAGHTITADDLTAKRPGTGISPLEIDQLIGAVTRHSLDADIMLGFDDVDLPTAVRADPSDR